MNGAVLLVLIVIVGLLLFRRELGHWVEHGRGSAPGSRKDTDS